MMYTVQTKTFQGPLHVLLEMIEEHKMEITELSLADVTQQFLEHIRGLGTQDPNLLTDFLTVASKLLVIKSKSLLPSLEEEQAEEEATDLTYQLLQFKRFKLVAEYLRRLEKKSAHMHTREGNIEHIATFYPDPAVNKGKLQEAMQSIARSIEEITKLPKEAIREVVSIRDKMKEIQGSIAAKLQFKMSELMQKKSKTEVVVTFLALLELIKQRVLTVDQENLFSDINVRKV